MGPSGCDSPPHRETDVRDTFAAALSAAAAVAIAAAAAARGL